MAATTLPLNSFKTRPVELTTTDSVIYATPTGLTAIILGAQVSNVGVLPARITFTLRKNNIDYVMLKEFIVPPNDAAEATTGKLVVEEGCSIRAFASANSTLNLVLSLLETSNE
jgi:hypothetical protein